MAIKGNMYLYQDSTGLWIFQVFVPAYMRHISEGKRVIRRSAGTRDIEKARDFRDHMIIEWNKLKSQLKPDTHSIKIQRGVAGLHSLVKQAASKPKKAISARNESKSKPVSLIPKLGTLRDEYLSTYDERRALSTLSKTARAVDIFLNSIGKADISVDLIGRRMVAEFLDYQGKEGLSPQTLQNWLSSLSGLYEFAMRRYDNIPPLNPFQGHNLEAKRSVVSYEPFQLHQLESLLFEAEEEIRDVILIGLYSGMRLDEICSLKIIEIITIEGIRYFNITKGKTKSAIRYVPIHSKLIDIVDKYLSLANGEYLLTHANQIKRKDGKIGPYYSQKFTRLRNSVLPLATDRQCFHSLRGMFITELDRQGVSENRIALIVGHGRGKTESFKTYSQGSDLKELLGYIEIVNFTVMLEDQ
ncbi:tyrosine-type recombinase/integrase [Yersinia enterocolitica]|uniref:tyrosine-type recombinase/integrase n=1 Tax=Yersinia enterocolitica TaxID=630 RepID=UPI0021E9271B|nr:tyrosine-type recombinase/integrase [Yersinia enterocolitica]UYK02527.1 tyrosine-type recombinase/integrase [Yersinia enterocolitica]HDL7724078.1 tyrosine-type recombinase/integrase [Yersinia enterocolitica]